MKKQFTIFLIMITFLTIGAFVLANKAKAETEADRVISADTTWTLAGSPYVITQDILIEKNITLTINPGVFIKFKKGSGNSNFGGYEILNRGNIIAKGDSNNKIVFTSYESSPQLGDWGTIEIVSGGSIYLDYVDIKFASNGLAAMNASSVTVTRSNFTNCGVGIFTSSAATISDNIIESCRSGINYGGIAYSYRDDGSFSYSGIKRIEITHNTIRNNIGQGLRNSYQAGIVIQDSNSSDIVSISYNNIYSDGSGIKFTNSRGSKLISIENNNIYNHSDYNVLLQNPGPDIIMSNNWWGTTDITAIGSKIYDYYDDFSLSKIVYEPYALAELKFDGSDTFGSIPACASFVYSDWSSCQSNGAKTRSIISSSPNGCSSGNSILIESCTYVAPVCTSWTYSNWGACTNGQQTRTIASSQPINCAGGNPILNQSCNSTPLCTENNWASTLTPTNCPNNNQQTKKWTKTGQCQGGISHPTEESVSCNYQTPTCTNFLYSNWGECDSSGVQSRTILSSSPSSCAGGNPVLTKSCVVQSPICVSWIYSNWGNCTNGWQTRTIISSSPNNCIGGNPAISQSCQEVVKLEEKNINTTNNSNQTTESNNTNNPNNESISDSNNFIAEEKKLTTKIDNKLSKRISGNILLQVEKNGEGWYVYPDDKKKYYLGRPADAFNIMRNLGLGIKHSELAGYLNTKFLSRLSGKIMLDVEQNGEAYYIYPKNLKGYFLSRPSDAFKVMRDLGLGITNADIRKIGVGEIK